MLFLFHLGCYPKWTINIISLLIIPLLYFLFLKMTSSFQIVLDTCFFFSCLVELSILVQFTSKYSYLSSVSFLLLLMWFGLSPHAQTAEIQSQIMSSPSVCPSSLHGAQSLQKLFLKHISLCISLLLRSF